jgi:pilus assembly protein CpaF
MAMMGSIALPEKAIRAQIASAIDLIVQVARMSDGSRRITHISEITGTSGDVISMQDIFTFQRQGLGASGNVKGCFSASGVVPKFDERLKAAGIPLSMNLLEHAGAEV